MGPQPKAQVVIDEQLKARISEICCMPDGGCGVIVGQADGAKFLVTHLIRASKEPVESVVEGGDSEQSPFRLVSNRLEGGDAAKDDETDEIGEEKDEVWVFDKRKVFYSVKDVKDVALAQLPYLAMQTNRLLPGGMDVLGIFFTCNEEVPKPARPRLKEVITELSLAVRRDCPAGISEGQKDEKILLAFDPRTKSTITSLSLDASDTKAIIKPISVAYQKLDFLELNTRFRINIEKPTDLKRDVENVLKRALEDFQRSVMSSVCLFGERLPDDTSVLPHPSDRKLQISMLTPLGCPADDEDEEEVKSSQVVASGRLAFRGDIVGKAFVSVGTSVGVGVVALKNDLLRSMSTRVRLHCEDTLVTDTDEQEFDVIHELPRRILAPLRGSSVVFSNYLHEGEHVRDSLEIFVGLLDMPASLNTSELITTVENIPNQLDVDSALESVSTHSGDPEVDSLSDDTTNSVGTAPKVPADSANDRGQLQMLTVAFAVLFAILFCLYQVYLLNSNSDDTSTKTKSPTQSGEL